MNEFRDLLVALSGIADSLVLFAYGDMGRPTDDHLLVTNITDGDKGWPQSSGATVSQNRTIRWQIDGFGPTAATACDRLAMLLRSDDKRVTDAAPAVNISGVSDVSNRTGIFHTSYETRRVLEVLVAFTRTETSTEVQPTSTQINLTVTGDGMTATLTDV